MSASSRHRLQILGAALLFSTGGAAIKATTLTAWQVACFRSGLAALALMLAMAAWRRFWEPRTLLVGACYALTMILYVTANKLTTAANTIFLQSTAPIYVLLLGPRLLGERVRRADLVFTGTLATGMVLFFVGIDDPVATAPDPLRGNMMGALAGLTWAFTILGLRWLGRGGARGADSAGRSVVAGNLIACAVALPFALPLTGTTTTDMLVVSYLGVFQIGLAYIWMARGIRRVGALEASLLLLLEPVLNAIWAWWIHGERPGPWSLAGCSVILVATLVRGLRRS